MANCNLLSNGQTMLKYKIGDYGKIEFDIINGAPLIYNFTDNIIIKDFDYIGFDKFQSFMKEEGLEID